MSVEVDASKCNGCGSCALVCPRELFAVEGGKSVFKGGACERCKACELNCPVKAITVT
ncbi:MAG: 4Fe-4S binding protein [Candidatus Micrarchaeia archaeon]